MRKSKCLPAAAIVAGFAFVAAPAAHAEPDSTPAIVVEFTLTRFDSQVASDHDWEVRRDSDGWECSVPKDTPDGPCPADFRLKPGGVTPGGVIHANCGYSWLYREGGQTRYETGYDVYPTKGAPLTHSWQVYFDTNRGPLAHILNGLGPIGPRWVHQGSLNGATGSYGKATGAVLLSSGASCTSGGPEAS